MSKFSVEVVHHCTYFVEAETGEEAVNAVKAVIAFPHQFTIYFGEVKELERKGKILPMPEVQPQTGEPNISDLRRRLAKMTMAPSHKEIKLQSAQHDI